MKLIMDVEREGRRCGFRTVEIDEEEFLKMPAEDIIRKWLKPGLASIRIQMCYPKIHNPGPCPKCGLVTDDPKEFEHHHRGLCDGK